MYIAQKTRNKFLRIILNKPRDTPITELHKLSNTQTNQEYVRNSTARTYNPMHNNPLIRNTRNYNIQDIPLKIKVKLRKHGIAAN